MEQERLAFPHDELRAPEDVKDKLMRASTGLLNVRITQLETLVCRCLVKSKNPRKRIVQFYAEFADDTGKNAAEHISRRVAELVNAADGHEHGHV